MPCPTLQMTAYLHLGCYCWDKNITMLKTQLVEILRTAYSIIYTCYWVVLNRVHSLGRKDVFMRLSVISHNNRLHYGSCPSICRVWENKNAQKNQNSLCVNFLWGNLCPIFSSKRRHEHVQKTTHILVTAGGSRAGRLELRQLRSLHTIGRVQFNCELVRVTRQTSGVVAWGGDNFPLLVLACRKIIFFVSKKFSSKIPHFVEFRDKIEILNIHNLPCRKIATSCFPHFVNSRRRWSGRSHTSARGVATSLLVCWHSARCVVQEAIACLNLHSQRVRAENRSLRHELLSLIRKSQALREHERRLLEQRHALRAERQYADDLGRLRAERRLRADPELCAAAALHRPPPTDCLPDNTD